MAGRLAADVPRRPRLRLQVEHGLDARHARVLRARPDPPPLPPPRADVQPRVRVQRELHPAAVARRGRARQGLADRQDAGRPLAEAREPALAVRLHVGAPRQEAAVHGRGVRPGAGVERTTRSLDWHLLEHPDHCGHAVAGPRPQPRLPGDAGAVGGRLRPRAASTGSSPTTPTRTSSRSRAPARTRRRTCSCASATSRRSRAPSLPRRACRAAAAGSSASTPTRRTTAARTPATSAASTPTRRAGTASRTRPRSRCRRSASCGSCPRRRPRTSFMRSASLLVRAVLLATCRIATQYVRAPAPREVRLEGGAGRRGSGSSATRL